MRLICTECNAQYEIDAALLPDAGREVQCSSCGHVWFQEKTPKAVRQPPLQMQAPLPQEAPPAPDDAIAEPDVAVMAAPRKVDEKVLEILREEAEFEARQRAREAGTLETQQDLGLSTAAPWPSAADRSAKTPPPADAPDLAPKATPAAFPDIEDISASLEPIGNSRMGGKHAEFDLPTTVSERRRSFWTGLAVPVVLALVLTVPYLLAPEIVTALPASEPALTSYVGAVDEMRLRLSNLING